MKATRRLSFDGDTIDHRLEHVLVVLRCIRLGHAYRVSVCYGSTRAESQLSQSYPTEAKAAEIYDGWIKVFETGARIVDVIDGLAALDVAVAA